MQRVANDTLYQIFMSAKQGNVNARSIFTDVVKEAQAGVASAQCALGEMYSQFDTKKDNVEAAKWYQLAAEQGHVKACVEIAIAHKEGLGVKQSNEKMIEWYQKAYAHGYSTYDQEIILLFLAHFCNDPLYNPGKKRFSEDSIELMIKGVCAGLTIRFLAGALIKKISSTLNEKKEEKKPIEDDLEQFFLEINTLLSWDGKRELTQEEQGRIFSFLYLTFGYHKTFLFEDFYQNKLDRYVFLNKQTQTRSFNHEIGCTLCMTQDQLAKKLDVLRKTNGMIYLTVPGHAVGVFEDMCFCPNNFNMQNEQLTSAEIAERIFSEMEFLGYAPGQPMNISIDIFAYLDKPSSVSYPSYVEIFADCSPGTVIDPKYKHTVLHQAALRGHIESIHYFIDEEACDINAKNQKGLTALGTACIYDYLDIARLLLAHGAELSLPSGEIWDTNSTDTSKRKILQNVELLMLERQQNLASDSVKYWIKRGILPKLAAAALSQEQRIVLETITDIAKQVGQLPLLESVKKTYHLTDETIRSILTLLKNSINTTNESKQTGQVSSFHKALSTLDITTASMTQIRLKLKSAFYITKQQLDAIKDSYFKSKMRLFSSLPSSESLELLDTMKAVPKKKRTEIALQFVTDHPTNELAKQIISFVPGLIKSR